MVVKVLLLPDGDDPDSFAQSHPSSEVERYIEENEGDFVKFKTDILMKDTDRDPIARRPGYDGDRAHHSRDAR